MAKNNKKIWLLERDDDSKKSHHGLGPVSKRLGYLLHRTDVLHMQLIRKELAGFGLTPARATTLAFVHENPGCSQNDLGQALGINRASAMQVVNSLVALDAVERREGADRRSHALFLSGQGTYLFHQFIQISQDVDDVIAANLSSVEQENLAALFERMSAALHRIMDESAAK